MKQDTFIKLRIRKRAEQRFGMFAKDTIFNERKAGYIEGAEWYADNQWISVETELPKEDGVYLVLINSKVPVITTFYSKMMQWKLQFPHSLDITHWMPIPKLVK